YVPYRWHHLVAQKAGEHLELYIDGQLAGTGRAGRRAGTTLCRLLIGRLKQGAQKTLNDTRPFVGRLDEPAVYDRPPSAAAVRRHRELGSAGGPAPVEK